MVEILLRKWISKRGLANVTLNPCYSHPSVPNGEPVIAQVIDRSGRGLFFTGSGFALPGHRFIRYDEVTAAEWIASESFSVKIARKRDEFDRIELSVRDGSSVKLTDVGQAVFPLLHFFKWMIGKKDVGS